MIIILKLQVATHEMGHILGLKHADNSLGNAIMYALYTGYSDNLQLHQDDINGVVAAMGKCVAIIAVVIVVAVAVVIAVVIVVAVAV